ncbi:MAG: threonine/serine exporter family protein [Termitinemataceae bacterium]
MEKSCSRDPLALAADVGRRILEAGGETYRAEDAVVRICTAWGFTHSEAFATPTGLMASYSENEQTSRAVVRRIKHRKVDLYRIGRLLELVHQVEQEGWDYETLDTQLRLIDNETPYTPQTILVAAGCSAAFFTLLFEGSMADALGAFFVGVGIKILSYTLQRWQLPDFITTILGGSMVALISLALYRIGLVEHLDKTVIGSIMLMVPGLTTVNAIRDTIAGDLVAGIARLSDAVITAAALAIGAGAVFTVLG